MRRGDINGPLKFNLAAIAAETRKEGRKAGFLYAEGIFARRLNDPVTHSLSQEEPLFFSSAANNPLVSQSGNPIYEVFTMSGIGLGRESISICAPLARSRLINVLRLELAAVVCEHRLACG